LLYLLLFYIVNVKLNVVGYASKLFKKLFITYFNFMSLAINHYISMSNQTW